MELGSGGATRSLGHAGAERPGGGAAHAAAAEELDNPDAGDEGAVLLVGPDLFGVLFSVLQFLASAILIDVVLLHFFSAFNAAAGVDGGVVGHGAEVAPGGEPPGGGEDDKDELDAAEAVAAPGADHTEHGLVGANGNADHVEHDAEEEDAVQDVDLREVVVGEAGASLSFHASGSAIKTDGDLVQGGGDLVSLCDGGRFIIIGLTAAGHPDARSVVDVVVVLGLRGPLLVVLLSFLSSKRLQPLGGGEAGEVEGAHDESENTDDGGDHDDLDLPGLVLHAEDEGQGSHVGHGSELSFLHCFLLLA